MPCNEKSFFKIMFTGVHDNFVKNKLDLKYDGIKGKSIINLNL